MLTPTRRRHRKTLDEPGLPQWAVLAVLAVPAVFLGIHSGLPWWQRLLGAVPAVAAVAAGISYFAHRKYPRLPFLEMALLQLAVFWGSPVLTWSTSAHVNVTQHALTRALVGVIVVMGAMIATYPVGKRIGLLVRDTVSRSLPADAGPGAHLLLWPWFLVCLPVAAGFASRLPWEVRHLVMVLGSYYPVITLLAFRAHRSKDPNQLRLLLVCAGVLAVAGLFTGRAQFVIRPMLFTGVIYLVLWRRMPWRWVAALAMLIVLLQPAKLLYRQIAWEGGERRSAQGVGVTMSRWGTAVSESWGGDVSSFRNLEVLAWRLNELSTIAATFELTPRVIPFDRGRMWRHIPAAPLPRFLYPDKPMYTRVFNDRFNVTFGLQTKEGARYTTQAFPLAADGYWNFGWAGVVFVGAFIGLLIGMFTTGISTTSWGMMAFGAATFVETQVHANLFAITNGIAQRFLGLAFLCWAFWLVSLGFGSRYRARQGLPRPGKSWQSPRAAQLSRGTRKE